MGSEAGDAASEQPDPTDSPPGRLSIGLLRGRPAYTRLFLAELVSPLGDAMGILALILYVQKMRGTGTSVALLLLADTVPTLLSPFAGTLADRVDRRAVMIATSLSQATVVAIMAALLPPMPVLFALVFGRGLLATAFQPAARASVPALVEDAELLAANSLLSASREVGVIVGPPLAGLLFPLLHARGVLAIDALTFVVVVPLLAGLPRLVTTSPARHAAVGVVAETVEGLRYVLTHRLTRAIAIGFWLVVLSNGADDLVLPFLGRDVFRSGPFSIGVLLAGASVGLVGGLAGLARWGRRVAPLPALVVGFAVTSTGNLLTALAPTVAAAVTTQIVRGLGIAMIDANVQTLLQRGVPRRLLGRVMANVWGGVGVAAAASYAIAGPLLDATSPRTMFILVGVAGLTATALTLVLLRGGRSAGSAWPLPPALDSGPLDSGPLDSGPLDSGP